ncbi:acyl-CoA dehydrogenase family protein [Cupriavidus sp. AcVe19-1a]|uniref:acyl-CoA dehydrogenase family protein n=1 Tax=Cupriavidus sp. AcVe19-1a TaxID=2821359 RepID=UPI001AE1CFD1|nr:acyl-CoA dehydrogenase family protein [Cupriavidus sp. AcVe19-1a]MBP0630543.1 hypothetical protein [Cupriavidus sp. AcVe19-1a]
MADSTNFTRLADNRIPAGDDWLSPEALSALTQEELVRRAKALTPVLAANAKEAERIRRPVDSVWQSLRDSGMFYHFVPKMYGGLEFDLNTFVDAMIALGEGCASTAWVAAFCIEHNWLLTQFPKQAQDEIFGSHPYVIAPGVTAPPGTAKPVDDGYMLSGRWMFGTGVMHADWIMASGAVEGSSPPQTMLFVFPAKDAEVIDTWHVDGMSGTGSNDIVVRDLFVPSHRSVELTRVRAGRGPGTEIHASPIFKIPTFPFQALAAAAPAIGLARSAVAYFRDGLKDRIIFGTASAQAEKPAAQIRLARADAMVRVAEIAIRDAARATTELGISGEGDDPAARTNVRVQIAYAVDLSRSAIRTICEGSGAKAHSLNNPLQRAMRDINVIASHVAFDLDGVLELQGRIMIGLPPNTFVL